MGTNTAFCWYTGFYFCKIKVRTQNCPHEDVDCFLEAKNTPLQNILQKIIKKVN